MHLLKVQSFLMMMVIPAGQAQFIIEPLSVVQAEGLDAVFQCLYPGAFAYSWRFNGIGGLPQGVVGTNPTSSLPARLVVPVEPRFNNSDIKCEAAIRDVTGGPLMFQLSEPATLQVQGILAPVIGPTVSANTSNCFKLTISWSAPFTLNLTTIDPPYIQYCVDVYNVTGGGSHHLDSVCGITDTQYTYTAPDPTGVYNFTVTPRSNIQGSLNGTISQSVQFSYDSPRINDIDLVASVYLSLELFYSLVVIPPCRLPGEHSVAIQAIDVENLSKVPCFCSVTRLQNEELKAHLLVDCSQCGFERHRRYNLTLYADSVASEPKQFSTHDVNRVTIGSNDPLGELKIVCEYLFNSSDQGFFIILYSADHILYRVAKRIGSGSLANLTVSGLRNNVYRLAVYDLTDNINGFLQPEQLPAVMPFDIIQQHPLANEGPTTNRLSGITVSSRDKFVCILCVRIGLSGCVGVIHSAPLDTYNLTVLTARAGVEECTSERFQGELSVAVFDVGEGGLGDSPSYQTIFNITDTLPVSDIPIILSVVVTSLATFINVTVIMVICVYIIQKKKLYGRHKVSLALDNTLSDGAYTRSRSCQYSRSSFISGQASQLSLEDYSSDKKLHRTGNSSDKKNYIRTSITKTAFDCQSSTLSSSSQINDDSSTQTITTSVTHSQHIPQQVLVKSSSDSDHQQSKQLQPPTDDIAMFPKAVINTDSQQRSPNTFSQTYSTEKYSSDKKQHPSENNNIGSKKGENETAFDHQPSTSSTSSQINNTSMTSGDSSTTTSSVKHRQSENHPSQPVLAKSSAGTDNQQSKTTNNIEVSGSVSDSQQHSLNSQVELPTVTLTDEEEVLSLLQPVAKQWCDIGQVFGASQTTLDFWKGRPGGVEEKLRFVVKYKLNKTPLTLRDIVDVLKKIGQNKAADQIIEESQKMPTPVPDQQQKKYQTGYTN